MSKPENPWEPDPAKMGDWRSMFESRGASAAAPAAAPVVEHDDADIEDPSSGDYRPWTLQRGSGRSPMMLAFRRFDPRVRHWYGWAISYPYLVSIDYHGTGLLSLDFGKSQVVLEGQGLDELTRHLQQGNVLGIQEFSSHLWQNTPRTTLVSAIRRMPGSDAGLGNPH